LGEDAQRSKGFRFMTTSPRERRPPHVPAANDVFPSTQYTLIDRMLQQGDEGRIKAAGHVMSVYLDPLRVYYHGSSFRSLGAGEDLVQGFFADRLSRDGFLAEWLSSSRQLRFWLITAFRHYLFEHIRRAKKHRGQAVAEWESEPESSPAAEIEFHRSVAMGLVRQAMELAAKACADSDLAEHWRVLVRHVVDGRSYDELRIEFGLDEKRFKVMARTAGNKFRAALRDLIRWRGASDEDLDAEILDLMEIIAT